MTPGVSGPFPLRAYGLAAGRQQNGTVQAGQDVRITTTVPSGAKAAQFAVRSPSAGADVDLFVYRVVNGVEHLVGVSGTSSANETVTLRNPPPGTYVSDINGFATAPGTTSTPYSFTEASVTSAKAVGNLTVTPANPTAKIRVPITVRVSWTGVSASRPHLGYVQYQDGSGTIVTVN